MVLPKGFEPLSMVPETIILSIELREQLRQIYEIAFDYNFSSEKNLCCLMPGVHLFAQMISPPRIILLYLKFISGRFNSGSLC